ncbi:unnamed protein product [Brachionus calyciflorus]|uniref:OTU domain-containing protein n=1 Tax=Brachionus calyciflorus TaxID=104777 RepID=A0A813M4H6_9BILA|nr:unnamed protein product [Brachionus calyciflorus]
MTKNQKNKKNSKSSSYLQDDENYESFSQQLKKLGLEIRDITGDGNCCFRALSDQMEGNESQHLDYRKRVCQFIRQNRNEFEPFIAALIEEDDTPKKQAKLDVFGQYIKNMEQPGTYADNLCLVAFARLYQLNINIHQIGLPIWTISGIVTQLSRPVRELHLSYHNGEHYSSIRPIGDKSKQPTNIFYTQQSEVKIKNSSKISSFIDEFDEWNLNDTDELDEKINQIMSVTNIQDIDFIREKLVDLNLDTELTINYLLANNSSESLVQKSKGKNKKDKKTEKKQKQMQRHQNKIMEIRQKKELESTDTTSQSTKTTTSNVTLSNIHTQAI